MREISNAPLSSPASAGSSDSSAAPKWFGRAMTAGTKLVLGVGVVSLAGTYHLSTSDGSTITFGPVDLLGQPIEQLQAAPVLASDVDFDGDGLSDEQERVLGLKPFFADTDFDGYNDGEEIARQSDPFDESSIPTSEGISASLTAHGGETSLRLVIVMHEPSEDIGDSKVRIGALTDQGTVSVPIGRFIAIADILTSVGSNGSQITTIDIPIHAGFVHANEHVTFFLAAGNKHVPSYAAGAKVDVLSKDNVLMVLRPMASNGASMQGGGSIRQPIPPSSMPTIPTTWVQGAVCFQRSVTVGGSGAVVLKQIIEAECLQGFDSYCASDCSSTVGSTFRTIDPGVFIGG